MALLAARLIPVDEADNDSSGYSARSASTGSTVAARFAGT